MRIAPEQRRPPQLERALPMRTRTDSECLCAPWHTDSGHTATERRWRLDSIGRQDVDHDSVSLVAVPVAVQVRVVACEALAAEGRVDRRQRAARPRLTEHVDVPRRAHIDYVVLHGM